MRDATAKWMIYGANGYTGELIAREAVASGERPVLAGRRAGAVGSLAAELGLEHRIFELREGEMAEGLRGIAAVVHCAGPFSRTSAPMVQMCLRLGVDYLDITGEIAVFESIFALEDEAQRAGVTLIPGVGFDVVPTDCLALMLAERLPGASELILAFSVRGGGISRGTLRTALEGMGRPGAARRNGRIVDVPVWSEVREVPFSSGSRTAVMIPWGDVSTAWRTTGIADISVFSAISSRRLKRLRSLSWLTRLARFTVVRRLLDRMARRRSGPDSSARESGWVELWGKVTAADGREEEMWMRTPEGYRLTALAAVSAVRRLLEDDDRRPGAFTPASFFGPRFALDLPGVELSPVAPVAPGRQ